MSDIRKLQTIRDQIKQQYHNHEYFSEKHSTLKIIEGIGIISRELTRKTETTKTYLTQLRKENISHTLGMIGIHYITLLAATDTTPPPDAFTLTYESTHKPLHQLIGEILAHISHITRYYHQIHSPQYNYAITQILRPLNELSRHLTQLPILNNIENAWKNSTK